MSILYGNLTSYKTQFDNLMLVISDRMDKYNDQKLMLGSKYDTINKLLTELKSFADDQFRFFYVGFNGGDTELDIPLLHPEIAKGKDIEYPAEHVLATIIAQVSADLTTIQLVAEQRITAYHQKTQGVKTDGDVQATTDQETNSLFDFERADSLASKALWGKDKPSTFPIGEKSILTYMTDAVRVRVMPYSSVALIGLPYTAITSSGLPSNGITDWDTLGALNHEVGHLRFWLPFVTTKSEVELLGRKWDDKDFILNVRELYYPFHSPLSKPGWHEEIFADVYGVWRGGLTYIFPAMDMALAHSSKKFIDLDLEDPHPAPLIRPFLMFKAFKSMVLPLTVNGNTLWPINEEVIEQIEIMGFQLFNAWKRALEKRNILHVEHAPDITSDDDAPLLSEFIDPEVEAAVAEIVDWNSLSLNRNFAAERLVEDALIALLNVFAIHGAPIGDGGPISNRWGKEQKIAGLANAVRAVQEQNQNSTSANPSQEEAKPPTAPPTLTIWQQWTNGKRYFKDKRPVEMWAGEFNKVMDPRTRPTDAWLPIFAAGGWTTEGPCVMPPG